MDKKILVAVDGSEKGFSAVSILGNLLKDRSDFNLVVLHCVQQLAQLAPGELCMEVEERLFFIGERGWQKQFLRF